VLIAADDPGHAHHPQCRQRGYRFIADPSQQLAFSEAS
jgi:adenosine kinase